MKRLHRSIEQMWWTKKSPPLLFRLFEPLYSAINRGNLQRRAKHVVQPPLPLISVGNITVGGSGKTPFVIWLAKALKERGYQPVILCRGDGGSSAEPRRVESSDEAAVVGDEALLMAQCSGSPVISAADRVAGCQMARSLGDLIILDDGFQYRHLGRSCDIVLVPGEGVGNGHQIPAGPLREPIDALQRADIIVRSGDTKALESSRVLSDQHEWQWQSSATVLTDIMNSGHDTPTTVYAITAIARPQRFFDSLKTHGLQLSGSRIFPDHHRFTAREIKAFSALPHLAVTAKDAVKLAPFWPAEQPLWVLQIEGHGEAGLIEAIVAKLGPAHTSSAQ